MSGGGQLGGPWQQVVGVVGLVRAGYMRKGRRLQHKEAGAG